MAGPWYLFAGGGTGGHLFPGLAVAEALRGLEPEARVLFCTSERPLDRQILGQTPYESLAQSVRPWSGRPWRWVGFWRDWRRSVRAVERLCEGRRPRAVLGLGGFAAGPAVVVARRRGIRCAILNPDAVPGRANRVLARRVDLVVLQWGWSRECFGRSATCETWGCPVREAFFRARSEEGRERFGLDAGRKTLLVTGASQGAQTINRAMLRVWPAFAAEHAEWQLLHLTGPADEVPVRDAYAAAGVAAKVLAFTDAMPDAMAAADLVLSRAGASTLAEIMAVGRASILVPYPFHRDRHQHANARALGDAGAALVVEDAADPEWNARGILAGLRSLSDDVRRSEMARQAKAMGRTDAARRVAHWLVAGG